MNGMTEENSTPVALASMIYSLRNNCDADPLNSKVWVNVFRDPRVTWTGNDKTLYVSFTMI